MKKILTTALLAIAMLSASANALISGIVSTQGYTRVAAYDTDEYTFRFLSGWTAGALLSGDGDTDLDLYVYDGNGNLICKSDTYGDDEGCTWSPSWSGNFTIRIKNRGSVYNRYFLKIY